MYKRDFRYSWLTRVLKTWVRRYFPVPKSPYTEGYVEDICSVNLVPPDKLKKFFAACIKELQVLKGANIGDYWEFGVFNGSSMSSMYDTCRELGVMQQTRFFGFDAFEGLPPEAENEDDGVWKKGFYHCPFHKLEQCLMRRGVDPGNITWVKGWFNQTLNSKTVCRYGLKNPGIVFIDCDTYSSSKTVLDFIAPLITAETIICLDDWKLNDLDLKGMGEYRAFNEFLDENPHLRAEELISYNRKSKTFLITPRS